MKKVLSLMLSGLFLCQLVTAQTSLQFDATIPNYVDAGNSLNTALTGTNSITVEAWCYLSSYSFLPTAVGNYGSGMQFLLRVDGNKPAFWIDNGGGFRVVNGITTIPLNTWTHLAGVWDGSNLLVYINGVLDGSTSVAGGALNATTNPVRIGASLLSEAWDGKLDDIRIWSNARTVAQISGNMAGCVPGNSPGLLALYIFEEGTGTSVADLTGHGYTGTLVSSPIWTTGFGCSALAVNFVSISAKSSNEIVLLNWKVAAEQDILRYEVERSVDARSFSTAGSVVANESPIYTWTDVSPSPVNSFYRVKSIDRWGAAKYSGIATINTGNENAMIQVSPNPVQGRDMHVLFKNKRAGKYDFRLVDATGRLLFVNIRQHAGGNSTQTIELPHSIGRGFYQLIVTDEDKAATIQKIYID